MMAREGIGLSTLVSTDGKAIKNIDEGDILEKVSRDSETSVIVLCLESIIHGHKFMDSAKKIAEQKPIVVLKCGKSLAGSRAVLSHSASLAGSDEICSAAFKQSHILRAQTIEELLDFAKALSLQPPATGSKIAIITNGGGAGIVAADASSSAGLEIVEFSESLKAYLKRKIPLILKVDNPLDLKYSATAEVFEEALKCVLTCEAVDAVILMIYPSPVLELDNLINRVVSSWNIHKKPIVVSATGSERFVKILCRFEENSIPVYVLPERAVNGLKALVYFGRLDSSFSSHGNK
jgi:acyl-CoA synthetase (NDP forming)